MARRVDGVNDQDQNAVAAAGAMTEALETLERARGHLYSFHELVGEADFKLDEVLDGLASRARPGSPISCSGSSSAVTCSPDAGRSRSSEEFDDGYYGVFRAQEKAIRDALTDGQRHVLEARMKAERRPTGDR